MGEISRILEFFKNFLENIINIFSFFNPGKGDVLLIGGKAKSGVVKNLEIVNTLSHSTKVLLDADGWKSAGGPVAGFYRHCSIVVKGEIYVLGGNVTNF